MFTNKKTFIRTETGITYSAIRPLKTHETKFYMSRPEVYIVKLQSSLTVQSKSVGLGVDFVFPPSQLITI